MKSFSSGLPHFAQTARRFCWRSVALVFSLGILSEPASVAAAAQPSPGYQLFKGDQARRALAGTLLRVAGREVVRPDGSKATIYRDVDYPVRAVTPEGKMDTGRPRKPADETPASKPETDADNDASEPTPPKEIEAYVLLGPEYEDPPTPGTSPSPNRLRRAGPSSVVYEWDEYVETQGKGDEYLRLELDFSGTHVAVRSGLWRMEAEAGEAKPTNESGFDFFTEQGAYGSALGRIESPDLHRGAPDLISVTLAGISKSKTPGTPIDPNRDLGAVAGGRGSYRLKRVSN